MTWQDDYNRARDLSIKQKWNEARVVLLGASEQNPFRVEIMVLWGWVESQSGFSGEALKMLRRAVDLAVGDFWARFYLGCALLAAKRAKEAVDVFRQAVEIDPNSPDGRWYLARAIEMLHPICDPARLTPKQHEMRKNYRLARKLEGRDDDGD